MKKAKQDQAALLRGARKSLGWTNRQLAEQLGLKIGKDGQSAALLAWLAPKSAKKHRTMPASSRLLLARILAEHRAAKRSKR